MAKRYGINYKGSKNAIAEWVVDHLPEADTLVDAFCGGCAHRNPIQRLWIEFHLEFRSPVLQNQRETFSP